MQSFKLVGTFTFADSIKRLKLGDTVNLKANPYNKINPKAIGVYTKSMEKIGYLPFNINQTDCSPCTITELNLVMGDTRIIISRPYKKNNFLLIRPKIMDIHEINRKYMNDDVNKFKKFLELNNNTIDDIYISYYDENYIDLYIVSNNLKCTFYTVTKKYYDENIFSYDEFYELKLIPFDIYQPFKLHRLECYIEKKYDLVKLRVTKNIITNGITIHPPIDCNEMGRNEMGNEMGMTYLKFAIKFLLCGNKMYSDYLDKIGFNMSHILYDNEIKDYFKDYNVTEIAYNHNTKKYCNIDLYSLDTIVLIEEYNKRDYNRLLLLTEYKNLIIYNPIEGKVYKNNL